MACFRKVTKTCSLIALLSLWTSVESVAANQLDPIFSLSLSELAQVNVVSKRLESAATAPGIVTVISAQDIANYGARHLRDLLDRLPNTQIIGSNLYPHNRSAVRGVTQTHLDDKVLILLNGRPLREAGQGGINGDIYSSFPLSLIKQIEVIRGPGSVLYGTNAFGGVINIVTRKETETKLADLTLSAGSFGTRQLNLTAATQSDELSVIGSLSSHHSNGDSFSDVSAEIGEPGRYDTGRRAIEAVIVGNYAKFSFSAIINKVNQDSASNLLSFPSEQWQVSRRFFDLGYLHEFNSDWSIQGNITYNGMNNTAAIIAGSQRFFTTKSRGTLVEATLRGKVNEDLTVIFGGVYDHLKGDNVSDGSRNTDIDTWRSGLYSQLDYQVNDWLTLSTGFQYNKPEDGNAQLSPRLVAVMTLSPRNNLKLLYEEAFRSAFGLDLFLDAEFLLGNPNLKPETITTYSVQFGRQYSKGNLSATVYQSLHEDLIVRVNEVDKRTTLANRGHIHYNGVELETNWQLNHNFSFIGNASYQTNKTETGIKDSTFHPNWMFKSGLSYQKNQFNAGIFASYFGAPKAVQKINPNVQNTNTKVSSYILLSANFSGNLPIMGSAGNSARVSLYIDNLLDQTISSPDINRLVVNSIPGHAGRGYYLSLQLPF